MKTATLEDFAYVRYAYAVILLVRQSVPQIGLIISDVRRGYLSNESIQDCAKRIIEGSHDDTE